MNPQFPPSNQSRQTLNFQPQPGGTNFPQNNLQINPIQNKNIFPIQNQMANQMANQNPVFKTQDFNSKETIDQLNVVVREAKERQARITEFYGRNN